MHSRAGAPLHTQALPPAALTSAVPRAGRRERLALRLLQLAAVAVVLAAVTWREFELDRFFVPKELTLHTAALGAALLTARRFRAARFGTVDLLLLLYLALSAASALLAATNGWLALRALAVSASGVAIFWAARTLREAGLARPLLGAVALAVVIGAATALAQAYGMRTDLFSINRAPGGTFGNRNFVAHMAAFGLPVVLLMTLRARSFVTYLPGAAGAAIVVATLVLTRSRAGWLAVAAALLLLAAALLAARALRAHGPTWRRLAGLFLLAGAAVAAALLLPNELRWQSDSPYRDSLRDVANYQEGSGAGRLVQYRRSLEMAAQHPLLGVGPGNWPVAYPEHAAPRDPSLSGSTPGTTSNPWPSSDWVAFVTERGAPAALLLALALAGIAARALRRLLATSDADEALGAATLLATMLAATIAGLFDAVLLLALPSLLVFATLGALATAGQRAAATPHAAGTAAHDHPPDRRPLHDPERARDTHELDARDDAGIRGRGSSEERAAHAGRTPETSDDRHARRRRKPGAALPTLALAAVTLLALAGTARSAAQLTAMGIYNTTSSARWLARAALIDPGNFRLRLRLARGGSGLPRAQRCEHARAAHAQFPSAREARSLARGCGGG